MADWLTPLPADALLGRGQLGGSGDFGRLTRQVLAAGYDGYAEVQIFNQGGWDPPADEVAANVKSVRGTYRLTPGHGDLPVIKADCG